MFRFFIQCGRIRNIIDRAIYAHAHITFAFEFLKELLVLAFSAADAGRYDLRLGFFRQGEYAVHDLVDGLFFDWLPAVRAMRHTATCIEQAQIVVYLRHGADRAARVVARAFLVDGDCGRKPVDAVDIRLLHLPEKLARIGRQALNISALSFRIDRVKREAGFSAAGKAGEHDELVARNHEVDVLQVVLPRAFDDDVLHEESLSFLPSGLFPAG
ncbi:hypothetical protein SDC9_132182 [bioreactor metagenome]|uniref:Uncharacterized protein n=1 Tax=bioreactor metagenome TaxID=1076179 RepID=A0A645D7C2_9ZZZZ